MIDMATMICLKCRVLIRTLKGEQVTPGRLDNDEHEFVTIAKGNSIEGMKAEA